MNAKKVIRIISLCLIVGIIFAAMIFSMVKKTPNSEKIWDEETTVGNIDAKNYFIIYSDLACPYCLAFENAIIEHEDNFKKYIEENDVLVEVRLSDFLYEYGSGSPIFSRNGAVATYCAKNEGKFWDYYYSAVSYIWNSYFKDTGKSAVSELSKLDKTFWLTLGSSLNLSEDFETCVKYDKTLDEVMEIAKKSASAIDGMPYFKFNSYIASGFDLSWGYDYVLMYFNQGLKSR